MTITGTIFFTISKRLRQNFIRQSKLIFKKPLTRLLPRDYEEAKERFLEYLLIHIELDELINRSITSFTSDYALYWFDYLAGYDTIFVELGWNHNVQKHIGLCRGAATVQQKDWGSIIVSTTKTQKLTTEHTRLDQKCSMTCLFHTRQDNYIIIFNYPTDPPGNPYGILTDEHFEAMQKFWDYMQHHPEDYGKTTAQAALPENYAWGMRHRQTMGYWGYWGPDDLSSQVWTLYHDLLYPSVRSRHCL